MGFLKSFFFLIFIHLLNFFLPGTVLAPIRAEKDMRAIPTRAQSSKGLVKLEYRCATDPANSERSSVSLCSAPPKRVSKADTL